MKLSRLMILGKMIVSELRQMARPRSVQRVEMDGRRVELATVKAAAIFAVLYFFLLMLFSALFSLDGIDVATSFTASLLIYDKIKRGEEGAFERYIDMLKTGGSAYPLDEVKAAGVDFTRRETFYAVPARLRDLVDELEALLKE